MIRWFRALTCRGFWRRLRLDQIINVISIVMLSLEFLLGLFAAGTFWRFGRY